MGRFMKLPMLKGRKFFIFSDHSLVYREIRFFRTKISVSVLLTVGMVVAAAWLINVLAGDPLGFGRDELSVIAAENRILKEELAAMSGKLGAVERNMQSLAERGNELRLLVDLDRLDDDTRQAAAGGSVRAPDVPLVTGEPERILTGARDLLDRLSREVRLQQASYEEIYRKYEYNKGLFAHMPAIKPMAGTYAVNGFGMRVHPVLGVYRMHEGVDIINDEGTEVFATGDGSVTYAGRTQGGYGTVIEIHHGYGYTTLYAHLSRVLVRPGQKVSRGELIARSGRSGLVSGPHLHYEVRLHGRQVSPVDYFFDDVDAARYRTLVARTK